MGYSQITYAPPQEQDLRHPVSRSLMTPPTAGRSSLSRTGDQSHCILLEIIEEIVHPLGSVLLCNGSEGMTAFQCQSHPAKSQNNDTQR